MGSLSHQTAYVAPPAYSSTVTKQILSNWVTRNGGLSGRALAYSSEQGLYAIGPNVNNGYVYTSKDTINWTIWGAPSVIGNALLWNPNLGLWLNIGGDGGVQTRIDWSPDAANWTIFTAPNGTYNEGFNGAFSPQICVATCEFGIMYSLDGKAWFKGNGHGGYQYSGVAYSPSLGVFTAMPGDGGINPGVCAVSNDGMSWKTYALPAINYNVRQIAWCDTIGLFIAANSAYGGAIGSGQILASPDGAVWSVISPALAANLVAPFGVSWSPDLGCVVLMPTNAGIADPICVYSFDAKTWYGSSQLGNPPLNALGIVWSSELGVFVAAGANNDGVRVSQVPAGKSDFISITTGTIYAGSGYTGQKTSGAPLAGAIGEIIVTETLKAGAVALANGVTANVAQIVLTPGEWDVSGNIDVSPAATTVLGNVQQGSSSVSATLGAQDTFSADTYQVTSTIDLSHVIPTQRYSVAANTTIYLVVNATFTVSTCAAYGTIRARRVA